MSAPCAMARAAAAAAALALTSLADPRAGLAQSRPAPSHTEVALSREEYRRGIDAARDSRWEDARAAFERALALNPQPVIRFNLAVAQSHTGRLLEAAENCRRFLREAVEGPATVHRPAAEWALAELDARTPRARLSVPGLLPGDALALDGRPLSRAALGPPLPLDPGDHALAVTRGTSEVGRRPFTLRERETAEVVLRLPEARAVFRPPPAARAPARPPDGAPPRAAHGGGGVLASPWFWGAVALAVVGGAAAAVGVAANQPLSGTFSPGRGGVE